MPRPVPARLHALLASRAPVGVVLRRGPSNAVCPVLWERDTDTFRLGQWLRGRIYERRADLSPDGRHLIYFARNGRWSSETKGSWTAVSRAPWLKAIALYGKGDCWQGGGLFTSNTRYWLNGGCCHFVLKESREVRVDTQFAPPMGYGGECPGVYYPRLQRDGWILRMRVEPDVTVFEKALPGGWTLRKFAHAEVGAPPGKGCYWDEHELECPRRGVLRVFPEWEWAEWDRKTLVWAAGGCLWRAALGAEGPQEARLLHDFNPMRFEAREAPY